MSLTNGVYVVEFEDCRRVFHTSSIEHYFYYDQKYRETDFAQVLYRGLMDKKSFNLDELGETLLAAYKLYQHLQDDLNIKVLYGIQIIKMGISWNRVVKLVNTHNKN